MVVGVLWLWFGFMLFVAASAYTISTHHKKAERAMINAILCPASSAIMTFLLKRPGRSLDRKSIKFDRATVPLGLLSGAAAVSSCADNL